MKLPRKIKSLVCTDRTFPIRRRRKVKVGKESVRGSFDPTKGVVEIETGPEELETAQHETGHIAFEQSNLAKEWRDRLGEDLAQQLEEQVCDRLLPLHLETLKRNGLL